MVQNVEQILSRGERIELLVDKTDTMASQATAFRRGARSVRRQMWWKNSKIMALSALVVLVSLFIRSNLQSSVLLCCNLTILSSGPTMAYRSSVLRRRPQPMWRW